jgi:hypothetical protein
LIEDTKTTFCRPLFLLRACLALLFLNSTLVSFATPGNEHWDAQFGAPGVTNAIFAVAVNQGTIYVGGQSPSGGRTNTPLSMWDGKQWSVPAVFTGPTIVSVFDLAFVGNTLYAAGNFTNVNGTAAYGLARWDGTNWSSIGFSGIAYALAVEGNKLYVGGNYTNVGAGGVMLTNIGYWDGSAWQAMGNGVGSALGYSVRSVAVQNGTVYAGGLFFNGTLQITNLAMWNGANWSGVGGGVIGQVNALAFYNGALYAGGTISKAGTTTVTGIVKWDGANWSTLGTGLAGGSASVASLASFNGQLCAIGSFTSAGGVSATNFAAWNGSFWSAGGNLNITGNRVVANGGKLYAGGSFTIAGGVWVNEIASWDGSHWNALGVFGRQNGVQDIVSAIASDGTNLYAGGYFLYAGLTNAGFIARFDGTNWQQVGAGLNNRVCALAVTNNLVYAGGFFTGTADGHPLTYVGCWDGTNWNSLGSAGGVVYALAVGSNGVYAAGTYYTGNAYGTPYFSRWDGTNWNNMISFAPGNTFFATPLSDPVGYDAIAIQGTNVFLGGNILGFTQFDPNVGFDPATNCQNIIRFDGTYGWIMGTGLNTTKSALAALGTNLHAGGLFTQAGGIAANQIARWDGNAWYPVGGGVVGTGTVLALTTLGNNLYAAGTFTNMGNVTANRIAKWDGTNWYALGDGISGSVQSLVAAGSNVYAGGSFRYAGGKNSFNLARWDEQLNFNVPQILNAAWSTNGQFLARLSGIGGLTNLILATTNFTTWTPVLTNTSGIYDFTDPNSTSYRSRFYRAVLGP